MQTYRITVQGAGVVGTETDVPGGRPSLAVKRVLDGLPHPPKGSIRTVGDKGTTVTLARGEKLTIEVERLT